MITQYKNIFLSLKKGFDYADFLEFAQGIKGRYNLYLIANEDIDTPVPFDKKFIGAEMGLKLPSLAIFDKAIEQTGCLPAECIYVDGDLANIHSAEEVGMAPILLYNGNGYYDTTIYSFSELLNFI